MIRLVFCVFSCDFLFFTFTSVHVYICISQVYWFILIVAMSQITLAFHDYFLSLHNTVFSSVFDVSFFFVCALFPRSVRFFIEYMDTYIHTPYLSNHLLILNWINAYVKLLSVLSFLARCNWNWDPKSTAFESCCN